MLGACLCPFYRSAFQAVNLRRHLRHNPLPDRLFTQPVDNDQLSPRLVTFMENKLLPGDLEKRRKEREKGFVRRLINRWRGQGQLQGLIMNADQPRARGPGLDIDSKQ